MKRMIAVATMIAAATLWAGCGGGGNNAGNGGMDNKPADNHEGHGHGDEHTGEKHALGAVTLDGGYTAIVTQIGKPKLGDESIFEVKLEQGGKAVEGATVEGWLADEGGKQLAAASKGEWNSKESMYDVHTHTPKELPAKVMLWVRVIANDGTESKGSVAIDKD